MDRYWELSGEQARELLKDSLAVIPVGSVEQHCEGPLGTDLMLAEGLAAAMCEHLETTRSARCVLMPSLSYGFSAEWSLAPGTISLSVETFQMLVKDVVRSLIANGAKRIVLLNGHYGNSPALEAALRDLMRELPHDVAVLQVNYWEALGVDVGHASEEEAELMRALGYTVDFGRCPCRAIPSPAGVKVYTRSFEVLAQLRASSHGMASRDTIGRVLGDAVIAALGLLKGASKPLP